MSERSIQRAHARRSKRAAVATVAAGAVLAAGAGNAQAATFNVTNLNDSGAGSLRDAIDQANASGGADTITFQSGLSGTINVASELQSTEPLTIQGPGAAAVTLDGGDATRILGSGSGASLSVSALSFANGNTSASGGAIVAYGSLALDDVTVTGSHADSRGGGVFVGGNRVSIANSRFNGNDAGYSGGGLGVDGYSGVAPEDAVSITGSSFTGNSAVTSGGGITLYDSYVDVLVDTTTVSGNQVTGANNSNYEDGGGIWFEDTYDGKSTTVSNSTVSGNSAADDGGGISFGENFYAKTEVVNSTIVGNTAGGFGGGIQFADIDGPVPFTLVDSTVTGNQASTGGGGVFAGYGSGQNANSPLDVSSSVVSGNSSTSGGADFDKDGATTGDLTLGNVLVGTTAGLTYTADPAGSNIVGVDPKLGPLADNGGPTQTQLPAADSPLVDAGLANGLTTDQRGLPRTFDYPGVPSTHGSDGTDIGAVELGDPTPPDTSVKDPFLEIASPQKQKGKKIKVKVEAGAGEPVTAQVYGKIFVGKGNAVMRTEQIAIPANGRTTITVVPKTKAAKRRIAKALGKGRKVKAKLTGKL